MSGEFDLARSLGRLLKACGLRITTAESCTGGWIAKTLTDVPGSSAWFERGFVTYSNDAKHDMLDVPVALIERYGAVSGECVAAMAEGALRAGHGDVAVAVSGIAGPDGGSAEKPVGTVWFGFSGEGGDTQTLHCRLPGDREAVRRAAVSVALRGVIDRLGGV
ncbi:MAG: nicotinamide-nucleotide amidase [Acidihalobacter sp.]|uniref:nicotinamide-nucleotide amidase n=1 Tax=Acidihalobacter sp. TaxID=1872108 RepID=UPI00307E2B0D